MKNDIKDIVVKNTIAGLCMGFGILVGDKLIDRLQSRPFHFGYFKSADDAQQVLNYASGVIATNGYMSKRDFANLCLGYPESLNQKYSFDDYRWRSIPDYEHGWESVKGFKIVLNSRNGLWQIKTPGTHPLQ